MPKMLIRAIRGLSAKKSRQMSFVASYLAVVQSLLRKSGSLSRLFVTWPPGFSNDDLGRALAERASTGQWQAERTFESQGARYRELLVESGLIRRNGGELTEQGEAFLARRASVWWVNQGATYTKERDGGFLWAPLLNKAGRPQYHWDTMDEVRVGDVVLHYSNGSLRAASRVSAAARPAPNPLGDQSWEEAGRLVETRYQELNEPVALGAIDASARIRQGSPFTSTGSVQQVYLVRLNGDFVHQLAQRFPELAEHLPSVPAPPPSVPLPEVTAEELFRNFEAVVDASGLRFPAGSNLIRSFLCSLLAKPFAILTGLAGSGKTQLAMRLGEWFGTDEHGRHRHIVVPVRPDWTGPESIFGYEDALRTSATGGRRVVRSRSVRIRPPRG